MRSWHAWLLWMLSYLLLLILPATVNAQTSGAVSGTAKDPSGQALQGARAQLSPINKQAVSDTQGQFRIYDVPSGHYTLTISYLGFAPFTKEIDVQSAQWTAVDAVLQVASHTDEVIVKAERVAGEAEAINIERTADNIVQVLPSKVITSLPNTNIADAVGRLPSVTLERDEGEGKYVQIRGTEPRLSNVTINGVLVPSPEGGVRNIKLDAVPSDLVDRIEVEKTLLPNQDGDAIGGSVNLVTKTPGEKATYTFNVEGGYTPIQEGRWLDAFSGTIGQRFGTSKKLGILVGGTYDRNNRGIDDVEPGQAIGNFNNANFGMVNTEDIRVYKYYRTRGGFDGDIDYSFSPGSNVYLKGLFSGFHDYGDTRVYTPNAGAIVSHSGSQTVFDNTGSLQYRHYIRRPDQQIFSIDTGGVNQVSSNVINYEFAVSRGHNFGGQDFPTTYFNGPSNVTMQLDESDPLRPRLFPIDGTPIFNAPNEYSIASTTIPSYHSTQLNYQGAGSISRPYTFQSNFATVELGFKVRHAHKTQLEQNRYFNANNSNFAMARFLGNDTAPNYYGNYYGNSVGPFTDYNDINAFLRSNLFTQFTEDPSTERIVSDPATWDTRENVYAGYLMNAISINKWRVIGGLRVENTGSNYHANKVTLNNGAYLRTDPVTGSSSYTNYMPSVQVQYLLEKNTNIRLAYGRGISRPDFQDIVPAVQVDPNASPKSIQIGNPDLKPTTANNYDILAEHYIQTLGVLQAGYFYKDLSNPIYPTVAFVPASDPNFPGFLKQTSINGPSAHINGFESAWQQRLSRLPGLLSGFGVSANYSYTTSRVTFPAGFSSSVPGGQGRIDHPALQRQAPNTWNLGLTYDRGPLSIRYGLSHNDANIYAYGYVHDPTIPNVDNDPVLGIKGPLGDQYLYAHTQHDIQGSYRFYRGVQLVVSGLNLSNEVFGFYTGSKIYPNQREFYKPTVTVGLRWTSGEY